MPRTPLHFLKIAWRQVLCAGCVAGCFLGAGPAASAQPDVEGKPDSSSFIRIPADTDDWTRHFRIGAMVGMNISASFSRSGSAFGISGNDPANGIYDDGYVRADQTGNTGGYTSNWGYNNASQYNAANNTLAMHATTAFSATGSANADNGAFPGFDMAYGDNLWYWKHARVGWELGFGLLPINLSENSTTPATITQSTFTFNTGGIVVPTAPYQGGSGGTGPILSTTYTSITNTTTGTITGSQSLDVMLYTVRLGPSFYWDITEHIGVSLGAGPAIGVVSGNYKYNEIVAAAGANASNSGKIGGTDVVYGGYVNGALMYHLQEDADIYIGAQYMPMSDATIGGGGREGQLKLEGQLYLSLGINWPF